MNSKYWGQSIAQLWYGEPCVLVYGPNGPHWYPKSWYYSKQDLQNLKDSSRFV